MLTNPTTHQLAQLRLPAFIEVYDEINANQTLANLSLSEALALMAERELLQRKNKRVARLIAQAKLRYAMAYPEDIYYHKQRACNQPLLRELLLGNWVANKQNLALIGPTGIGKTFIACALAQQAVRRLFSVRYFRLPRLIESLFIAHADGTYHKFLEKLAKINLLIIDDWGLDQLERQARKDLLEVIEDRSANQATLLTTQLPVKQWHDFIGDPTIADAICDRLLHQAHILHFEGQSERKPCSNNQQPLTAGDH